MDTENTNPQPTDHTQQASTEMPDNNPDGNIPTKFWDDDNKCIRTDALLKSYNELEKRFSSDDSILPETSDGYTLNLEQSILEIDQGINERLHQAGFTQQQAQLVYDLAQERLLPMAQQQSQSQNQQGELSRLEGAFGGDQKWQETSRQLKSWGQSNLPDHLFSTLNGSYEGIMAMHKMMTSSHEEPSMISSSQTNIAGISEASLKEMMQDKRYWRDQDPKYIEQVRKGFEALYPN